MGYHRAGFDVIGVDINPRNDYPFPFVQGDAIEYLQSEDISRFDLIHASPPCQAYTATNALTQARNKTRKRPLPPKLIEPTRGLLVASGKPYVIENVVGAPLRQDLLLCGSMFAGLRVRRHRIFEIKGFGVRQPCCHHSKQGRVIGVFGDHPDPPRPYRTNGAISVENARDAMGIDWMKWLGLCEAIPPAYTEYIGESFMLGELSEFLGGKFYAGQ